MNDCSDINLPVLIDDVSWLLLAETKVTLIDESEKCGICYTIWPATVHDV
jgi:hypothetical protein